MVTVSGWGVDPRYGCLLGCTSHFLFHLSLPAVGASAEGPAEPVMGILTALCHQCSSRQDDLRYGGWDAEAIHVGKGTEMHTGIIKCL